MPLATRPAAPRTPCTPCTPRTNNRTGPVTTNPLYTSELAPSVCRNVRRSQSPASMFGHFPLVTSLRAAGFNPNPFPAKLAEKQTGLVASPDSFREHRQRQAVGGEMGRVRCGWSPCRLRLLGACHQLLLHFSTSGLSLWPCRRPLIYGWEKGVEPLEEDRLKHTRCLLGHSRSVFEAALLPVTTGARKAQTLVLQFHFLSPTEASSKK